jgi:hypothetical protein
MRNMHKRPAFARFRLHTAGTSQLHTEGTSRPGVEEQRAVVHADGWRQLVHRAHGHHDWAARGAVRGALPWPACLQACSRTQCQVLRRKSCNRQLTDCSLTAGGRASARCLLHIRWGSLLSMLHTAQRGDLPSSALHSLPLQCVWVDVRTLCT